MERKTGISPRPCSVSIRVYPSWHTPPASEIAVFTVSDGAVFAETLFGTLNGAESSAERAVNVQIPAIWLLSTLIPVFRSIATHGPRLAFVFGGAVKDDCLVLVLNFWWPYYPADHKHPHIVTRAVLCGVDGSTHPATSPLDPCRDWRNIMAVMLCWFVLYRLCRS
jgi:hypothetical protein